MLLLIITTITAIEDAHLYGYIPGDIPTFSVYLNGEKQGVVALKLGDDWYRENEVNLSPGQRPTWYFETPWAPQAPQLELRGTVVYQREIDSLRKQRLSKGWEENGYTFEKGPNGVQRIYKAHIQYAQRSRTMALAIEEQLNPPVSEGSLGIQSSEEVKKPGVISLFGPHIIILLVGLLLLAIIIKTTLIDSEAGWDPIE